MKPTLQTQLVVIGSGPGGYSAAFRAADLGMEVTLIERYSELGGVCLNVGCIPSKALLHVAQIRREVSTAAHVGLSFSDNGVDLDKVRAFKQSSVDKLSGGVSAMAKERKVRVLQGYARFSGSHQLLIEQEDGVQPLQFEQAIIAAGSRSVQLPFIPHDDARVWDSTAALELRSIPPRLLVIGGGIIGLELGTVYQSLGSQVTVVEASPQLVPAADKDLIDIFQRSNKDYLTVLLSTRVTAVEARADALGVTLEDAKGQPAQQDFDAILVAVGRRPNGLLLDADKAGVKVDERGFIPVNKQMQTSQPHIFAIGDIAGEPMLAHKATHEGHVAAEVAAGHRQSFDALVIPSIAYTNPEIAWVGLTEKQARQQGLAYQVAAFPWKFNGRAIGADRVDGKTKLIYDEATGRLLGAGLVGINAGELLAELTLAIEFGATVDDIALTIHAHPTLSESVGLAAELAVGTITDLPNPRAKKTAK
ncbi:dihydrolipoyl dehydrogenase [Pokkaliibacter plantistimulans]|uniref:Dihydrolipoyl dehydrogenase n=1 Tax=Proteobacteria bacterium 228 TaxID=2083153 RepID=A0A2S5KQ32_9PROT|nr:dihydrolipoyl dehydrogenase [Pokkaliibacter plantistimulans]PPC76783.1 dihydrolipoyl dehydrogenase [Pokkaliibacter plantistimulans]